VCAFWHVLSTFASSCERAGIGKTLAGGIFITTVHHENRQNDKQTLTLVLGVAKTIEPQQLREFGIPCADPFQLSKASHTKQLEKRLADGEDAVIYMTTKSFLHAFGGMGAYADFGYADPDQVAAGVDENGARIADPPMVVELLKMKVDELLIMVDEHQFLYRSSSLAVPCVLANLRALSRRNCGYFNTKIALISKGPNLDNCQHTTEAMVLVYQGIMLTKEDKKDVPLYRQAVDRFREEILVCATEADLEVQAQRTSWMTDSLEFDGGCSVELQPVRNSAFNSKLLEHFTVGQLFEDSYKDTVFDLGLDKPVMVYTRMPRTQKKAYAVTTHTAKRSMFGFNAAADAVSFFDNDFLPGCGNYPFNPRNPSRVEMRKVVDVSDVYNPNTTPVHHYHALLVIVGTDPSRLCRAYLSASLASFAHDKTTVFDYTNITDRTLLDKVQGEVRAAFNADNAMVVVVVTEKQIHGANAFSYFTATALFGCMTKTKNNKYFQEQCHNRLARTRVPQVGDIVPVWNGYKCIHISSEITMLMSKEKRASLLQRALHGEINFNGDKAIFTDIFTELKSRDLGDIFARNFFYMKNAALTPLTLYSEAPEFLAQNLLSLAREREENSNVWKHALQEFLKKIVIHGAAWKGEDEDEYIHIHE
jgi:hypothetical protein